MLHQELFEDCSFNDSTHSKEDHIWMKQSLLNCIQSHEEMYDWNFYTSSLWSNSRFHSWNWLIQLRQQWSFVSIWWQRCSTFNCFFSKNMFFAECNYKIYDKELLIIIWAFEHWWFELKLTDISIKMFIDHQALISLMKDKELSRC